MKDAQASIEARIASFLNEIESSPEYEVVSAKSDIAVAVYNRMEELDISRAELARRLGKSRAYISKFLSGGTNVTVETLIGFARALDCHYSDFTVRRGQNQSAAPVAEMIGKELKARPNRLEQPVDRRQWARPQLSLVDDQWITQPPSAVAVHQETVPCAVPSDYNLQARVA